MRPYRSNHMLVALRHIRSFADSAMQAQLYECSDGHQYVLKLPGNNQGVRCIFNDFMGTQLGKRLGLPVLESSFVHVIPELLPDPNLYSDTTNLKNGEAWGTRFLSNSFHPKTAESIKNLSNQHLIPLVIAFDHWILNWDRAPKMTNLLISNKDGMQDWYLIDHGIAFASTKLVKHSVEWNLDLLKRYQSFTNYSFRGPLYDLLVPYVKGYDPFQKAIKQIQKVKKEEILDLMKLIPGSWNISVQEKEAFAGALITRAQHLSDIMHHSKDYYPGWR
jgi:hypothetical protein